MSLIKAKLTNDPKIWNRKILARCAIWDWHDSKCIDVLDYKGNVDFTLNEWETLVFHEADGNNTIEDIISLFPTLYKNKEMIPKQYEKNIFKAAEDLIFKMKLVELWDRKEDLAYYFDLPKEEQNEEESFRLMKENGLIT